MAVYNALDLLHTLIAIHVYFPTDLIAYLKEATKPN